MTGIAICGKAGRLKEKALTESGQAPGEFRWVKGFFVALFAGVMSACMAFAFAAGKPIGARAAEAGCEEGS